MSQQLCILCGRNPVNKNKEHIIPQWAIKLSGEPNRTINFSFLTPDGIEPRPLAFDQFTFPACSTCNRDFNKRIEIPAQSVVQKLLTDEPISNQEFHILLNWFDKVRIGLWLGVSQYHGKNAFNIKPHYYVEDRIGKSDRMLVIGKASEPSQGLSFFGYNTKAFLTTPACFGLRLNHLCFINVAYKSSFLAESLGLPYGVEVEMRDNGETEAEMRHGRGRIEYPPMHFLCTLPATRIFQPMFDYALGRPDYMTEYAKQMELFEDSGIGKPHICRPDDDIHACSSSPSVEWIPPATYSITDLLNSAVVDVLRVQNYLSGKQLESIWKDTEKQYRVRERKVEEIIHNEWLLEQMALFSGQHNDTEN